MTCDESRQFVHALLDGELAAGRSEVLEGHLAGCKECRRYSSVFTALKGRLGDVFQEAVAPESPAGWSSFSVLLRKTHRRGVPGWEGGLLSSGRRPQRFL